ncbi:uncharacterized protein LOC131939713 [Physella acuta]|uniref:uncharacterized protein LOC131939713 n=1 Tax=Physella acuta TaxID=109671 RepID=UPI0027DBE5A0|nr:uncharacterized protein LOC131939713 [Physella acuta]
MDLNVTQREPENINTMEQKSAQRESVGIHFLEPDLEQNKAGPLGKIRKAISLPSEIERNESGAMTSGVQGYKKNKSLSLYSFDVKNSNPEKTLSMKKFRQYVWEKDFNIRMSGQQLSLEKEFRQKKSESLQDIYRQRLSTEPHAVENIFVNLGDSLYTYGPLGQALRECMVELLQIRPKDPIEYTAMWLYRFADTNCYYKKRIALAEEMVHYKNEIDEENLKWENRKLELQKHIFKNKLSQKQIAYDTQNLWSRLKKINSERIKATRSKEKMLKLKDESSFTKSTSSKKKTLHGPVLHLKKKGIEKTSSDSLTAISEHSILKNLSDLALDGDEADNVLYPIVKKYIQNIIEEAQHKTASLSDQVRAYLQNVIEEAQKIYESDVVIVEVKQYLENIIEGARERLQSGVDQKEVKWYLQDVIDQAEERLEEIMVAEETSGDLKDTIVISQATADSTITSSPISLEGSSQLSSASGSESDSSDDLQPGAFLSKKKKKLKKLKKKKQMLKKPTGAVSSSSSDVGPVKHVPSLSKRKKTRSSSSANVAKISSLELTDSKDVPVQDSSSLFLLPKDADINVKDARSSISKELDLKQKILDVESRVRFSDDPDIIKIDLPKEVTTEQKKKRTATAKHKKKPATDVKKQSLPIKKENVIQLKKGDSYVLPWKRSLSAELKAQESIEVTDAKSDDRTEKSQSLEQQSLLIFKAESTEKEEALDGIALKDSIDVFPTQSKDFERTFNERQSINQWQQPEMMTERVSQLPVVHSSKSIEDIIFGKLEDPTKQTSVAIDEKKAYSICSLLAAITNPLDEKELTIFEEELKVVKSVEDDVNKRKSSITIYKDSSKEQTVVHTTTVGEKKITVIWSFHEGNELICSHSELGELKPYGPNQLLDSPETWLERHYAYPSFYEPEIYTNPHYLYPHVLAKSEYQILKKMSIKKSASSSVKLKAKK